LGVVFFELLTGNNPFYGRIISGTRAMEDEELKGRIEKGFNSTEFKNRSDIDLEELKVLKSMLMYKPNDRISIEELVQQKIFNV
jgi:serine/threonine protein kinase